MDDEVAPVLLVLAAPDELRIEVAVAALVGDANRALLLLLAAPTDTRPSGCSSACRLVVREGLDGLALSGLLSWP